MHSPGILIWDKPVSFLTFLKFAIREKYWCIPLLEDYDMSGRYVQAEWTREDLNGIFMVFLSQTPDIHFTRPGFSLILGNTLLSAIPGISGAGPSPEKTFLTPVLDAELILTGRITSLPVRPNTPTGCPTPATITRAMIDLTGLPPLFVNAGLRDPLTVSGFDTGGAVGGDPRAGDAVPGARALYVRGQEIGRYLSYYSDLLVLGECVPGGTTTALCVLRALGYPAAVSSSFARNPVSLKEEICKSSREKIASAGVTDPLEVVRIAGDPMIPVAAGITDTYRGTLILAGGTQMLAVGAVIKALNRALPLIATTVYVRDDSSANVRKIADLLGVRIYYVDPGFDTLGHEGLSRYCSGEVKEGSGAGGAMLLARLMGHTPEKIQETIIRTVRAYD